MKTKTRTHAIRHARETVGELYRFGSNQWRFQRYDAQMDAYWESYPLGHAMAQGNRSQALIDSARDFLGLPTVQYDGGDWTRYVPSAGTKWSKAPERGMVNPAASLYRYTIVRLADGDERFADRLPRKSTRNSRHLMVWDNLKNCKA